MTDNYRYFEMDEETAPMGDLLHAYGDYQRAQAKLYGFLSVIAFAASGWLTWWLVDFYPKAQTKFDGWLWYAGAHAWVVLFALGSAFFVMAGLFALKKA